MLRMKNEDFRFMILVRQLTDLTHNLDDEIRNYLTW